MGRRTAIPTGGGWMTYVERRSRCRSQCTDRYLKQRHSCGPSIYLDTVFPQAPNTNYTSPPQSPTSKAIYPTRATTALTQLIPTVPFYSAQLSRRQGRETTLTHAPVALLMSRAGS
ncbi:hypothetical protein FCM35_KLT22238 [Carex littledalei]|uniref:Uncharacterized protein n=1 Tax=Carex littledalei TaxID=544730 RepID=A0A833QBW8_9POAL|nr:hypothetical protein FCM35_KLT22238 [Carex littledalei]